jgi:hypothetical protein
MGLALSAGLGALAALPAAADQAGVCAAAGGAWHASRDQTCDFHREADQGKYVIDFAFHIPAELTGDPWAEQAITDWLKARTAPGENGFPNPNDPSSDSKFAFSDNDKLYRRGASLLSVECIQNSYMQGAAHPNSQEFTLVLDLANHKKLWISDLFQPGVDYKAALTPLVMRHAAEYAHTDVHPDGSRFTPHDFDPANQIGYNGGAYTDWVITDAELIIFLPGVRMGPVGAGLFQAHIPLAELGVALRPQYR